MPRSSSWRHRVSQILTALRTLDCAELQRAQIESLFGLQPRRRYDSWPLWFQRAERAAGGWTGSV